MQDSKPNWPIRVGGLYRPVDQNHSPARVTAIVGDQVHHIYDHGEHTYTTAPCSIRTFCKLWTPEDQSPIPALVAALKAAVVEFEHSVPGDCYSRGPGTGDITHYFVVCPGCAMLSQARAALALAGESEKESEDREELADRYKAESGKEVHSNTCATSVAPAEVPEPCDCDDEDRESNYRAASRRT